MINRQTSGINLLDFSKTSRGFRHRINRVHSHSIHDISPPPPCLHTPSNMNSGCVPVVIWPGTLAARLRIIEWIRRQRFYRAGSGGGPSNIESVNTAAACTTLIRGCGMGMETASEGCRLTDFGLGSLSRGRKSFIAGVVCLLTAELIQGVFLRSGRFRGSRM